MMKTAVDYNGSNSNSVINIATTTTIASNNTNSNSNTNTSHAHTNSNNAVRQSSDAATADAVTLTPAATSTTGGAGEGGGGAGANDATPIGRSPLLPEHQPQSVLRNRLQPGKSTNRQNHHEQSQPQQHPSPSPSPLQPRNFDASGAGAMLGNNGHDHGRRHLGSHVEPVSATPPPTPESSPARRAEALKTAAASSCLAPPSPAPSSSSSGSSASNSSTSSVIATPILERNGNASPLRLRDGVATEPDADSAASPGRGHLGSGGDNQTSMEPPCMTSPEPVLTQTPPSLPIKSASFSTFGEHLTNSSSPALVTGNSTTASTTPSSTGPAPSPSKKKKPQQAATEEELLQWKDMPQYLQFNPYVLKGYRPLQTFKGCLFSLFYWHNETINILTHALPIVYILAIVPGLMPWDRGYRFLSFCHVFGSVAPWCGSFVYHLFMNIERGENVYYRLLKLDMVGIWVSQSFGALPLVTATAFCFTYKWKWFIIISYCLFSLWGLYKALTASSPWQRRLCFALPFTMRSILSFLRTMKVGGGNPVALSHVYLQDGVSILGGAIGAMRIPEKWFPGLVDYYLNSHNIMHVLVVVAVYSMHKATIKDFEWMSSTTCEAFANATNETLETTFSANMEL